MKETGLTITLRGIDYPVSLDEYGTFHATVDEHHLAAAGFRDLRHKAEELPRRKVSVRFTKLRPDRSLVRGTATGMHSDGRKVLVKWDAGKSEQISYCDRDNIMHPLDQEQETFLTDLLSRQKDISAAISAFTAEHQMDLPAAVQQALKES